MMCNRIKALAFTALFLASAFEGFAVNVVHLSVIGDDVVLRWPSEPEQTFIIFYRPTLDPSTPWTALELAYAAAEGTNTTYVHGGIVTYPPALAGDGGNGSGGPPELHPPLLAKQVAAHASGAVGSKHVATISYWQTIYFATCRRSAQ